MKYVIYLIIMPFLGGGFDDLSKNGDVNRHRMAHVLALYSPSKSNLIRRKPYKKLQSHHLL